MPYRHQPSSRTFPARSTSSIALAVAAALLVSACGGGGSGASKPESEAQSVPADAAGSVFLSSYTGPVEEEFSNTPRPEPVIQGLQAPLSDQVVLGSPSTLAPIAANPDGSTYRWTLIAKPDASLVAASATTKSLTFTPDVAGVYRFTVTIVSPTGAVTNEARAINAVSNLSTSNGATVGQLIDLTPNARVMLAGVREAPPVASPDASVGLRNTFYIDSALGNDSSNGTSSQPGANGSGPWKTLGRLATVPLAPGDTVVLACGSVWRETLRLPVSGTSGNRIHVTAPPGGCATKPAIDGSVDLPPSAWSAYKPNVYKASLESPALKLFSSAGLFDPAHHPNAGFDSTRPENVYLRFPVAGNVVNDTSGSHSTVVTAGSDLVLPAGATIGAGTRMLIRTYNWLFEELPVASFASNRFTLSTPTRYPIQINRGYFLLGQLWMVDSPGEWFYDSATKAVYAYMPNSAAPSTPVAAAILPVGIDLTSASYVSVDGVAIRKVGDAVAMRQSMGVHLRNLTIEDTSAAGIDITNSQSALVESSSLYRTGTDAISGNMPNVGHAVFATIRNNVIRDSGVLMSGDRVLSLPIRQQGAIAAGSDAVVTGNQIVNSNYMGIFTGLRSRVEDNFVFGACSVADDGAGIYTHRFPEGTPNNGVYRRNVVLHTRGNWNGLQPGGSPAPQGLYIDDLADGITMEDNTSIDNRFGLQVHNGSYNTIRNNTFFGNRQGQIWIQEDSRTKNAQGDIHDNIFSGNLVAPVTDSQIGLVFYSPFSSTSRSGSFSAGRYYAGDSTLLATTQSPLGSVTFGPLEWVTPLAPYAYAPVETGAVSVGYNSPPPTTINGSNLVPNPSFQTNATGWGHWNATAPLGSLVRETCAKGYCLRYIPGASPGLVASPFFSVVAGQRYRLSLDISTSSNNQTVNLVVRRGAGGTNGYESLSDISLTFVGNTAWTRHSVTFTATKTVNAADPITLDNGARVDLAGLVAGKTVTFTNVEIVPVTETALNANVSSALVNAGTAPLTFDCPFTASRSSYCTMFQRLSDGTPVTWPITVAPKRSVVVHTDLRRYPTDADGDGIFDAQDQCPGTAARSKVNAAGCSYAQR